VPLQRLPLDCDELFTNVTFNVNVRHYTWGATPLLDSHRVYTRLIEELPGFMEELDQKGVRLGRFHYFIKILPSYGWREWDVRASIGTHSGAAMYKACLSDHSLRPHLPRLRQKSPATSFISIQLSVIKFICDRYPAGPGGRYSRVMQ
jgi:hypothetical protein